MNPLKINTIETERLILREITPEIYKMVFDSYRDDQLIDFFGFDLIEKNGVIIVETHYCASPAEAPKVYQTYNDVSLADTPTVHQTHNSASLLDAEKEKYAKGLTTFNKSFHYYFLIEKSTKQNIGWCGFHTWYLQHGRAELGYGLNIENKKRKGLMTEALKPIIEHGFGVMNLNRIEAFASPANTPSIKLLQNFGFKEEGLLRKHYFKNEVYEDSSVWGLLKSEYKPDK